AHPRLRRRRRHRHLGPGRAPRRRPGAAAGVDAAHPRVPLLARRGLMLDDKTIPAMASAAGERFSDRLAIADGDTRLSYSDLFEQARRFGAALVVSGIQPGDRVAIWAFNSAEWVVALLGLSCAGAVLVPINTRWKGAEAADVLRRSRARLLVTVTGFPDAD